MQQFKVTADNLNIRSAPLVDDANRIAVLTKGHIGSKIENSDEHKWWKVATILQGKTLLEALKVDEWNRMIDVNIRGVLHGIAAGLPIMKEQGFGQFINISSIGGHAVSPTAAVYCATKFAVGAISEGLRQEVSDIRVTVISPGVTESELADSISDSEARRGMQDFRQIAIPPEAIARAIAFAIEQPDDVDVSEIIVRPTASPY
ncbi:MAG: SDR family NAD(P)-dependent oxidoreductase [Nostoc sp.]|uniref:SDR family oxidoreductase n=1 Tax=Nostoc sp. TaxID=1180 RepID=UPI002FF47060